MFAHLGLTSYAVLVLAVFAGAAGLPLPLNIMLAGAGGLAREGHLNAALVLSCSMLAAVAGDNAVYGTGRYLLRRLPVPGWLRRRAAPFTGLAHSLASMHIGLAIFLTRWAVTGPATPVNLLAGARRYPWRRFLMLDIGGEGLWVLISFLPGFLLGDQWIAVAASTLGLALLLAIATPKLLVKIAARRQVAVPDRECCAA